MSSPGDITRKLGITVEATDKAAGVLAGTKREIAGIEGASATAGGRFGGFVSRLESGASRMKTAIGGAASHFKRQMAGIASASVSLLGIGGLFGIGAIIGKSIGEAAAFGAEVTNVAKATGLATPVASALVDTMNKWGISSEKLLPLLTKVEKNLGTLGGTAKKATAFQKLYGLSLVDAKGHLVDQNTLLLRSADYFNNKAIPASQKAVVMNKLWGKSWQDMIPLLSKGSQGIKEEEASSIKLTDTQLANITKYRSAMVDFQDNLGDVEVKIGANLMPIVTTALKGVSGWLDTHGDDIATFFGNAADMAGKVAGAAIDVFGGIKAGWDSIPAPLRDLLVKGLVADRVVKFLFGFSPGGLVVKLGEEAIAGIAKAGARSVASGLLGAGIGKLFVQPVFVTNPGFGLPGGGGGGGVLAGGPGGIFSRAATGLGGALGGGAATGAAAIFGSAAALVGTLAAVQKLGIEPGEQAQAGRNIQSTEGVIARGNPAEIASALQGIKDSVNSLDPLKRAMYELNAQGVKTHTEGLEAALAGALADAQAASQKNLQPLPDKISEKQEKHFNAVRDKIEASRISTTTKQQATTTAADRTRDAVESARIAQVSATRTGDSAIVAAIRALRFAVNLTIPVTVSPSGKKTIRLSSTGGLAHYTGGPGGPVAEGNL